jgi:hypothetical protein
MELRKFKALIQETGLDDIGMSGMTFICVSLEKNKIYTKADQSRYDYHGRCSPPFFVDDTGCARDIAYMLRNKLVEEVKP